MNVDRLVKALKGISKQAKDLAQKMKSRSEAGEDVTSAQQTRLRELVRRLSEADQTARKLARADLERRIKDLDDDIEALQSTLSISGLKASTRNTVRARLRNLRARRARLNLKKGTDFSGLIAENKAKELTRLLAKAKKEVKRKQKAAAAIETTMDVAEIAIALGGRLLSAL